MVQVAQVYIVDPGLRLQLEAGTRNEIKVMSERAELQAQEAVKLAVINSERRIQEEALQTERQKATLEEEKLALAASIQRRRERESLETERTKAEVERGKLELRVAAEREALEAEAPVARLRHEQALQDLGSRLEELGLEAERSRLEVERDFADKRAEHGLALELLPLEQRPLLETLGEALHGTQESEV